MGTISNDALIVMGYEVPRVDAKRERVIELAAECAGDGASAEELASLVSPVIPCLVNGSASFYVAPDGSKERWDTSDVGDAFRARIVEEIEDDYCSVVQIRWGELGLRLATRYESIEHNP